MATTEGARRERGLTRARRLIRTGGAEGNERLTATTGVVLLCLLAVEGVTILFIRPLLSWHFFVGMLLIPPVVLKLGSAAYRTASYYRRAPAYAEKGPPQLLLRVLVAPVLVAATAGVFATGVALLVLGPEGEVVLGLHKASFVVWIAAFAIHVLAYLLRLPKLVAADWGRSARRSGRTLRVSLVALALVAGLILALATQPLASQWFQHRGGFREEGLPRLTVAPR